MKATNFLIQEHKLILRALDVLDAMSERVERTRSLEQGGVDKIIDFLRWFADAHHQAKEETILFPALKKAAASQSRPVEHMTLEHDQERALIEDMEKDLRVANIAEFLTCANRLSETLRNHIYKEDHILFETVDAVLSPKEDDAVLEQLNRFDTAMDKRLMEEKTKELRSLEWEYLHR
jgi:hemerythrin-like domain-containing protein